MHEIIYVRSKVSCAQLRGNIATCSPSQRNYDEYTECKWKMRWRGRGLAICPHMPWL